MAIKKNLIPKFKNDKDAAAFFDQNDTVDTISETTKVKASFPQPTHKIVISLNDEEWRVLRRKAAINKIPYTRFLKKIIHAQLSTT